MSRHYRFALVGDPVSHSRSPAIQRKALELAGLEGEYTTIKTDADEFATILRSLESGYLSGLNVTMPLKGTAFELADRTTAESARSRSANTLRCVDGTIEGQSTDVVAFQHLFGDSEGPLLVLGAGGSARAALAARDRPDAYISSRQPDRATSLAAEFGGVAIGWGTPVVGAILINATPLGMEGEALPEGVVEGASSFIDLPYGATETPAVTTASASGIPVHDGFEFLAIQAAASFQWWTGVVLDFRDLVEEARKV